MSDTSHAAMQNSDARPMVRVENLQKTYRLGRVDLNVLKGVDLQVQRGEFLTIFGHSGSGKSTLLHLIGQLDVPSKGRVVLDGEDTARLRRRRRNALRCQDIGFVFQFYYLLPELTVLENAMLPGMIGYGLARPARRKALRQYAEELLEELGLADRMKHRPNELSGGERQRVAIARGLINKPKLLLADEPTGNLDTHTGGKIMDLLLEQNRQKNQTILMVTHDQDLAGCAGESIELRDGQLVEYQTS